jgi:hypothetical protein
MRRFSAIASGVVTWAVVGGALAADMDRLHGVTPEEAGRARPLQPSRVVVRVLRGTARVTWSGTGEDLRLYRIYRRDVSEEHWTLVGVVSSRDDNRGSYEFTDAAAGRSPHDVYGVVAIDRHGLASSRSEARDPSTIEPGRIP